MSGNGNGAKPRAKKANATDTINLATVSKITYHDYRCRSNKVDGYACNRLLFHGYLGPGSRIYIRCPKCGTAYVLEPDEPEKGISIFVDTTSVVVV